MSRSIFSIFMNIFISVEIRENIAQDSSKVIHNCENRKKKSSVLMLYFWCMRIVGSANFDENRKNYAYLSGDF